MGWFKKNRSGLNTILTWEMNFLSTNSYRKILALHVENQMCVTCTSVVSNKIDMKCVLHIGNMVLGNFQHKKKTIQFLCKVYVIQLQWQPFTCFTHVIMSFLPRVLISACAIHGTACSTRPQLFFLLDQNNMNLLNNWWSNFHMVMMSIC